MNNEADPRIFVSFARQAEAAACSFLLEGDAQAPAGAYTARFTLAGAPHAPGCACCAPRGPAALALAALFRARATGAAPFFTTLAVRASPAGQAAVRAAVETDVTARARYRLA